MPAGGQEPGDLRLGPACLLYPELSSHLENTGAVILRSTAWPVCCSAITAVLKFRYRATILDPLSVYF